MAYKVSIESFEGPFDLLLHLVSQQKVAIGTISITQIADQYLAEVSHMLHLDLEVASDFLLVASTLLEIKAESLLPHPRDIVCDEIEELNPHALRELLVERLLLYKQYKNAANALQARLVSESHSHRRTGALPTEFLALMPDFLRGVRLEDIAGKAAMVLGQEDIFLLESQHIAAKPLPVETHVLAIRQLVKERLRVRFSELVGSDTPAPVVVVTFLALLELYKRSCISIEQLEMFGDIDIHYQSDASEGLDEG